MDGSAGDKEDQTDPQVRHVRNGPSSLWDMLVPHVSAAYPIKRRVRFERVELVDPSDLPCLLLIRPYLLTYRIL